MDIGDLLWVEFPARASHIQAGRRPAVVMQGAATSAQVPTVLVCPLTTRLDALRFPGTVLIVADSKNGLSRNSVALVFQVGVVDRRMLQSRLGRLADDVMEMIYEALDGVMERT